VTGTACTVATDRIYSADNIWVKSLSANLAVIGITTTMVDILYEPYNLSLSPVGTVLASDDDFGAVEGYKLSADLTSPVSGTLVQINNFLIDLAKQGSSGISPLDNDPYNSGWLVVVQLSKPSELNLLLTPQAYRDLVAQS
jgi:glycine cleavage system H protein